MSGSPSLLMSPQAPPRHHCKSCGNKNIELVGIFDAVDKPDAAALRVYFLKKGLCRWWSFFGEQAKQSARQSKKGVGISKLKCANFGDVLIKKAGLPLWDNPAQS